MKLIFILPLLLSCTNGKIYVDAGIGYIDEVTANQTTTIGDTTIDNQISVPLDSWFMLFRGGYRVGTWHIFEFERIGNQDRYFDTKKMYKRFEF